LEQSPLHCEAPPDDRGPILIDGEVARVPLGKGRYALVDVADFDLVRQFRWSFHRGYAEAYAGGTTTLLHRLIMGLGAGEIGDHINRDKLDSRRANLRRATTSQNAQNVGKRTKSPRSRFKGVTPNHNARKTKPWRAVINLDGRAIYVGIFDREEDAARAYDHKAVEIHGEFAVTNEMLGLY
jgi:hypothetical protein